jgi:acetyl esterase/lipase
MIKFVLITAICCLISQGISAQGISNQTFPCDTSFTPYQTWIKIKKEFPEATIAKPQLPEGVKAEIDVIYATFAEALYGKRDLHLDLFRPERAGKYPALLLIHGGGWRSGNKSMV